MHNELASYLTKKYDSNGLRYVATHNGARNILLKNMTC